MRLMLTLVEESRLTYLYELFFFFLHSSENFQNLQMFVSGLSQELLPQT